jgi:hypothetical protein
MEEPGLIDGLGGFAEAAMAKSMLGKNAAGTAA